MRNISALVDEAAVRYAARIAITLDGRPCTFAELADLSRRGAGVLADTGAKHVVYLGVGGSGFALSMLAAARAGIPYTPVNYRLAADQIGELVARFDDPIVIADPAYEQTVSGPEVVIAQRFTDAAAEQDEAALGPVDPDHVAIVLFTSGTTSKPKAVLLRHSTWYAYVTRQAVGAEAGPDDRSLVTVPPYHVMGVAAILNNYYVGRRLVFLPAYTPQGWLDVARAERVTSGSMVPTMMARMVRHLDGRPGDVPTLKAIAYGGSRTPRSVLEQILRAFPRVDFVHGYGLTETSADAHRRGAPGGVGHQGSPHRRPARLGRSGRGRRRDADPRSIRDGARSESGRRAVVRGAEVSASTPESARCWTRTAGSRPGTWPTWTPMDTCSCTAGPTTPSSAAGRTSRAASSPSFSPPPPDRPAQAQHNW